MRSRVAPPDTCFADLSSSLLQATSRTFALTIPLLPEPVASQVAVAYLLYRLADTLEDAELWGRDERAAALASFARWVAVGDDDAWIRAAHASPPTSHAGYMDLVAHAADVRAELAAMPPAAGAAIRDGVVDTTRRMGGFVAGQDARGALVLDTAEELRAYCYAVAGIVGQVLTRLFVAAAPALAKFTPELERHAAAFGEGLQLVNILKDAASDAREGRVYIPAAMSRDEAAALAARDLDEADLYVATLERGGAPDGFVAFCALPVALARATLAALARGEAKVSREEALQIVAAVTSRSRRATR